MRGRKIKTISNTFPGSPMEFEVGRIDTGWDCSITGCSEIARVATCGWKMCPKHAKRFNHGWGETIAKIQKQET